MGWTTFSQKVSQRSSKTRLARAALWDRAYSMTIERFSGMKKRGPAVKETRTRPLAPLPRHPEAVRGSCRSSPGKLVDRNHTYTRGSVRGERTLRDLQGWRSVLRIIHHKDSPGWDTSPATTEARQPARLVCSSLAG